MRPDGAVTPHQGTQAVPGCAPVAETPPHVSGHLPQREMGEVSDHSPHPVGRSHSPRRDIGEVRRDLLPLLDKASEAVGGLQDGANAALNHPRPGEQNISSFLILLPPRRSSEEEDLRRQFLSVRVAEVIGDPATARDGAVQLRGGATARGVRASVSFILHAHIMRGTRVSARVASTPRFGCDAPSVSTAERLRMRSPRHPAVTALAGVRRHAARTRRPR